MNNYIVSARKYRPMTFDSVVGQRALTTTLKNAISTSKLAHAYLFCGPRGVGKTTCARIFAKTINCLSLAENNEACNNCESCTAFNEQRSYNIHELDAASNNGVDDIRSLIEQVRIPPQIGKYKVYIIDEVHMLSQAAFNAFLKTLEEPPQHAVFILATTERHKVLPTILSRCQIYDFNRITVGDIVDHLQYVADSEKVSVEEEALNVLAQKADGGMRDALSIFDQVVSFTGGNVTYKSVIENLNVLDYEYYFKLTDCILDNNVSDGLLILNEILSKGFDGNNVLTGLATHFRDLLLCKDPKTVALFEVGASIKDRYVSTAQKCENSFLYRAIELINESDLSYRLSRNKRLLCDLTIIQLCQLSSPEQDLDSKKKNKELKPIFTQSNAPASDSTQSEKTESETKTPAQPARTRIAQQNSATPTPKRSSQANNTNSSAIGGLGVSLNAIRTGKKEQVQQQRQVDLDPQSERYTTEALQEVWTSYAETFGEEPHLRNTMLSCLPNQLEGDNYEIIVSNSIQEQKYLDYHSRIHRHMQSTLQNTQIKISVRISEEGEKLVLYSATEKFAQMMEENKSIQKLRDTFGLELS